MKKTTIWVSEETKDRLAALGRKNESYDAILRRLLDVAEGEVEVYVDFLSVNGESPDKHRIVFRLGDFIYEYFNRQFRFVRRVSEGEKIAAAGKVKV